MRVCLLCCLAIFTLGCQSPSHYWYNASKTCLEAKWDIAECGEYCQSRIPLFRLDPDGPSLFTNRQFEKAMQAKGYKQVLKSDLPDETLTETMWIHLVPHNIAGDEWNLPHSPEVWTSQVTLNQITQ